MLVDPHHFDGYPVHSLSSSSLHDVDYSCGSCGYDLNLNSCNRNTSVIGSWGWNGDSDAAGTYDIRIRALQPSSCDESNIFSNDI
uniref:Uncharacterized protein n=1 Tax=Chenopodium quinoa TaxID=63459 RepID=A0A803KNF2_CHEQI